MRISRSSYVSASVAILLLLLSPSNDQAQQQPKVLAPRRPIALKAPDSHVRRQPAAKRSLVGGLWMIDPNRKASIYLRNGLETSALTVTPTLFLSNGAQFDLSPVTLEPSGTAVVSINDALEQKGIASYATLSGYVEVKYIWAWDPLCVTVTSIDPIHSVIFSYGLQPSAVAKVANPRIRMPKVIEGMNAVEGMWWKPEANITGFVGLSNTSQQAVDGKLQASNGANQTLGEQNFHLSPHSTKLLKLEELAFVAAGSAGGLRIMYTGSGDGLVISGGLEDQTSGYSANLPFHIIAEPESTQTTEETYAELGLMTGAADPMMSFPVGTVFAPFSVVRNVTEKPVSVTPSLYWMQGGTARSAKLASFSLPPFQTQNLDISSLLARAGLASFHGSVNLILNSQGQSRSLLLASGSVDEKNTYVFQVLPRGVQESQAKTISYWSTGNGDDTMVTVWNPADEPQDFAFTVSFTGGHYRLPIHLEPRATQTFNISEIIQNQIPDADGSTIPPTVHEGSAKIAGTHADNEEILVALDAGTYNVHKATCSYYCISCDGTVSVYTVLNPFSVAKGAQTTLNFMGTQNTGSVYDLGGSWSSSNTNVATVVSYNGTVSGVNLGSVTMTALLNSTAIYNSYYCAYNAVCPYYGFVSSSGGGSVVPPPTVTFSAVSAVLVGNTATTIASVNPTNNTIPISLSVSSSASVVSPTGTFTQDQTSILVKGLTAGTATLTATASGSSSGSTSFTVAAFQGILTPSDNFSGRSTTSFGVGEVINLSSNVTPAGVTAASLGGLQWSIVSGGGSLTMITPGTGTATYTAPATASTVVLKLAGVSGVAAGTSQSYSFTVIAPSGAHLTKFSGVRHTMGRCSVGFEAYIFLEPSNVSFANVQWAEGTVNAVASGFWVALNGKQHAATAVPKPVGTCNTTTGCKVSGVFDTVDTGDYPGPFSIGDFLWAIPWQYKVGTGPLIKFTVANHHQTADALGKATISKAGAGPFSKNVSDPTSVY